MIKLKKILKEDINEFLDVVDTEDLWNIVSGPKGINKIVDEKTSKIDDLMRDVRREVLDNLSGPEYRKQRQEWKALYKEVDERTTEVSKSAFALYELGKKYAKWVESVKKAKK